LTTGSVLANDGKGTNVLSTMNGGTYTVQAVSTTPKPEVVEYVAPANTPAAPKVSSGTYSDQTVWYKDKDVTLTWSLPADVTAIRTLLDTSASTIPTKLYENPIDKVTLTDLAEGVSYFHIQFKNVDGWGKVTHYKLATDSVKPISFDITLAEGSDPANPNPVLNLNFKDETSGAGRYVVKVDNNDAYDYFDTENKNQIVLEVLEPGYHSVTIEAFDKSGNSLIAAFSFTVASFDRPLFTDYPNEINEEVIPVIKGLTRPRALVEVVVQKIGAEPTVYNLVADETGLFTLIPAGTFSTGVYELTAKATDEFGAQSDLSEKIRIAVQQPGYVQIGTFLINILSVVVPLFAMVVLLVAATWFLFVYLRRLRRKVSVESKEAAFILNREFQSLYATLEQEKENLAANRKTNKLTRAEEDVFLTLESAMRLSETRVQKEVADVEELVHKKNS
jgi:hypothetical protein